MPPPFNSARGTAEVQGTLFILISACGYGLGPAIVKPLFPQVSPLVALSWRFIVGGTVLWLLVVLNARARAGLLRLSRRQLSLITAMGILQAGSGAATYFALRTIPAGLLIIVIYTYPAMVAVVATRVGKRLEGRRSWLSLFVAFMGVVLTVGGDLGQFDLVGLLAAATCPFMNTAIWTINSRLAGERLGTTASQRLSHAGGLPAHAELPAILVGATMMTVVLVVLLGSVLVTGVPLLDNQRSSTQWFRLLAFGLTSGVVAIPLSYAGIARIGSARAAVTQTTEVVVVTVSATLLLGERLGFPQVAGCLLIISSVLLAASAALGRRPRE